MTVTFSTNNSLRIAVLLVFAAAALITFAAYHQDHSKSPKQESPATLRGKSANKKTSVLKITATTRESLEIDEDTLHRAAEAIRRSLNVQRHLQCPHVAPYNSIGDIKSARRQKRVTKLDRYAMEVSFNDVTAVFVLVERNWSLNETADTFILISSVPGPCDHNLSEQLAVSKTGCCRSQ